LCAPICCPPQCPQRVLARGLPGDGQSVFVLLIGYVCFPLEASSIELMNREVSGVVKPSVRWYKEVLDAGKLCDNPVQVLIQEG
jgi:hypothetical protein